MLHINHVILKYHDFKKTGVVAMILITHFLRISRPTRLHHISNSVIIDPDQVAIKKSSEKYRVKVVKVL